MHERMITACNQSSSVSQTMQCGFSALVSVVGDQPKSSPLGQAVLPQRRY
jgi:hypothetical protein